MRNRVPVYGLDSETDTTVDGLDPAVASVLTVALVGPLTEEVFTGPEGSLLAELDARLGELQPGVVATWNGAAFDLPFIADRAALHGLPPGLPPPLDTTHPPRPVPPHATSGPPLERSGGHKGGST